MKRIINLACLSAIALGISTCLASAQESDQNQAPPPGGGPGPGRPGGQFRRGPGGPQEMRPHFPAIVAALDGNHDGVIDETEISQAATLLQKLDKNNDGKLTPEEFMGPPMGGMGQMRGRGGFGPPKEILDKYDADKDGKLNETERAALDQDIKDGKVQPPMRPPHPPRPPRAPDGAPGDAPQPQQ